jgi:Tfp pilus assembly ATPase PilU
MAWQKKSVIFYQKKYFFSSIVDEKMINERPLKLVHHRQNCIVTQLHNGREWEKIGYKKGQIELLHPFKLK